MAGLLSALRSPTAAAALSGGGRGLRRLARGSSLRGGYSVVASGPADGSAAVSIAGGGNNTFTIAVVEDCFLDTLVLSAEGGLTGVPLTVTSISIDNDGLINGEVPAEMFAHDAINPPVFGHFVSKNDTIEVTVNNRDASVASIVSVGFTSAPIDPR